MSEPRPLDDDRPLDAADAGAAPVDATPADPTPVEPTPEMIAERARRADKATRGVLAGLLILEAIIVLLVPRAIAFTTGLGTGRTISLVVLAVVLVLVGGMQRRPRGIAIGSAMQMLFIATGFYIVTMFLVGAIFLAIWLRLLQLRVELVGSPSGWRMLAG